MYLGIIYDDPLMLLLPIKISWGQSFDNQDDKSIIEKLLPKIYAN